MCVNVCVSMCVCADRDRVSAWCVWWWKEALQHRNGAHHFSLSAVSGWADHRTGFEHCKLHHHPAAQVQHNTQFNSLLWSIKKIKKFHNLSDNANKCPHAFPGCPEGERLWSSPSTSLATPSSDCLTIWPFCTKERWSMLVQLKIQWSTSQI